MRATRGSAHESDEEHAERAAGPGEHVRQREHPQQLAQVWRDLHDDQHQQYADERDQRRPAEATVFPSSTA